MNNENFWKSIRATIDDGFTSEGLTLLDDYATLFINRRLIYKRFSSSEQHGCSEGGTTHVIASLLAGAEAQTNHASQAVFNFEKGVQQGKKQAKVIEL